MVLAVEQGFPCQDRRTQAVVAFHKLAAVLLDLGSHILPSSGVFVPLPVAVQDIALRVVLLLRFRQLQTRKPAQHICRAFSWVRRPLRAADRMLRHPEGTVSRPQDQDRRPAGRGWPCSGAVCSVYATVCRLLPWCAVLCRELIFRQRRRLFSYGEVQTLPL